MNKKIHILDNDLRIRSLVDGSSTRQSSSFITHRSHRIGRFDELTHFFNVIYGLFHQPMFTFGLNTFIVNPWTQQSNINLGFNLHLDLFTSKAKHIELLRNTTFYALTDCYERATTFPTTLIRFNTLDQNLLVGINHRWTPFFTSTFLFGTHRENKFCSFFEYHDRHITSEFKCEYFFPHCANIQLNYLSCLWPGPMYQIDGGFDCRIDSKEKWIDVALRFRRPSDSLIVKTNVFHPFEDYLIGFHRWITDRITIGLLAEKRLNFSAEDPSIRISAMSRWSIDRLNIDVNALINSENEMGLGLIKYIHLIPFVFQIFGLYSYRHDQYRWSFGLQMQM